MAKENLSLLIWHQERQPGATGYFFLPAADLAVAAALFCWLALLTLTCFWEDFFWLDFGDLSPMILFFFNGLTRLRHFIFSGGAGIVRVRAVIVNDGRKLTARPGAAYLLAA